MSIAREVNKRGAAPWEQTDFESGMVRNAPHDDIPPTAVADLINAHAFPTEVQPRPASYLESEVQPPVLRDDDTGTLRENYTASKVGDVITSLSGDIFTEADVSNYWVWPGDPSIHEEIQGYISATQVRVDTSGSRGTTAGCWIHGRLNVNKFQDKVKRRVRLWDERVFWANNTTPNTWRRAWCVSRTRPANVFSDYDNMDDYGLIANSRGLFQVDFEPEFPVLWRKNTNVPAVLVSSTDRSALTPYRHDYIYSMSRLSQDGLRKRITVGVKILQESGTCALNPNTTPPRDYGIRWHANKIGAGTKTNGRLQGGVMAAAQQSPDYYAVTVPAPGVSLTVTLNGRAEPFLLDLGPGGYNVTSMEEVADAFQIETRTIFPFITWAYNENGYFVVTSGEEDGSTLGYVTAGVGGTDISALIMLTAGTATSLDNQNVFEEPYIVGSFAVPRVPAEPELPEQHWTHYTVYRSTDIGPDGVTPRVDETTGENLPPLKFTWDTDIRIAGAFYGSKDAAGLVTAVVGTFEKADEGTALEWEDGDIDTILTYISGTQVLVSTGARSDYYEEAKPLQAIAIGGGRVIRASQTDRVVTIESVYNNLRFARDDERKTITWSTGLYSIIEEYISPTQVRVLDNVDKNTQGITLDPIERNFTDVVTDAQLRDRQGERHIGLLNHRFYVSMPNSNILAVVPGFLITAARTDRQVWYCQLEVRKKYLSGYHLELEQQIDKIESPIHAIKKAPNYFIIWCDKKTWAGPTNNPNIVRLPEFGEEYAVITADIIDEAIGCVDFESIREVDYGVFEMRCADHSWRQLNNLIYGADLTEDPTTGQDRIKKDLRELWNLGTSEYSKKLGHILYGKER